MPSVNAYLVADWPKGGTTVYRLRVGDGQTGWITGITNKSLAPLWFPKFGNLSYNIQNPAATLRVDSWIGGGAPMGPNELAAVYGSPTPLFPIEIVAILGYDPGGSPPDVSPEPFPQPAAQGGFTTPLPQEGDPNWGDDVGSRSGFTVPYLEIGLDYRFPAPVEFNASIRLEKHDPFHNDGCGQFFQLVGSSLVVSPVVDTIRADGIITSTTYRWHVQGAQVTGGVVDADTDNQPLTLLLSTPGSVAVTLHVTITSQIGAGMNVVTETGTRMSTYGLEVITQQEAAMVTALCKLRQDTLPIVHMVFPGDPARFRATPAQLQHMRTLGDRVSSNAVTFVESLSQVLQQYSRSKR